MGGGPPRGGGAAAAPPRPPPPPGGGGGGAPRGPGGGGGGGAPARAAVAAAAAPAAAEVSLPPLFGEGMVLQRDRPIRVFGRADAGEEVRVALAGHGGAAKAGRDGRWTVELAPLPAGGPHEMVIEGTNRIVIGDVLLGEVWLASGQSNMEMAVASCRDFEAVKAAAVLPRLRQFTVRRAAAAEPAEAVAGEWRACSPETVGGFSGVAFFFARELHRELGVPVGIVHASWGGTCAEGWTPAEAVARAQALRGLWKRWEEAIGRFDPGKAAKRDLDAREKWEKECREAARKGRPAPPEPKPAPDPRLNPACPGALWNGMIAPLVPLSLRGVIWYQGESNADRAVQYRALFPLLIGEWREALGDPELPFGFVQLASYGWDPRGEATPSGGPSRFAELREAQDLALRSVPGTGMAVAIDVGDVKDIHPKDKATVGRRLALWALARVHGREIEYAGPLFRGFEEEKGAMRIHFDHAAGLRTLDGKEPAGFAVAGSDGKVVRGKARIDGESVVVSHPAGARVRLVRYAWADFPDETLNLVNGAALPAAPFRTDDLPCVTEGRE